MNARDLILNIAVNLGRLSRWASEGKTSRIEAFMIDTESYINELKQVQQTKQFQKTYNSFLLEFSKLKTDKSYDDQWAEKALTWANILQHRAKLA